MHLRRSLFIVAATIGVALYTATPALAQNARGSTTGPTTAPGFSHPDEYIT